MTGLRNRSDGCYLLLDTPFGACGVAWSGLGLVRVQLPEATRQATEARISRNGSGQWTGPAPSLVAGAVGLLERYFAGERVDFSSVVVDLEATPEFHRQIYGALREIRWGETTTYGDLARHVGAEGSARAIGQAMGRNPLPVIIPCHRVLASGGALGGFSAPGGKLTKKRLLELEQVANIDKLPLFARRSR